MHKAGKKVKKERNVEIVFKNCVYTQFITLFLAFVRLLIYCVYTQFLKTIFYIRLHATL